MTRLIVFYGILAVIVAGVAAVVINSGADEKPMPAIAGGYDTTALNACIGSVPPPVKGAPLPSTAPASVPPSGPSFNVLQSGQFVNVTNNASTLGGQLRMHRGADAAGTFHLTGDVKCVNGGSQTLDARVLPGAKGQIAGTLDGKPFTALLKRDAPDPGSANPRTPPHIDGLYAVTPRSTCLGGAFMIDGDGPAYKVIAKSLPLGPITYNKLTGSLAGDISCLRGGTARITATANDLQLQALSLLPLDEATALPTTTPGAKPVMTTPSGLGPAGEKVTATKQRDDFNKLVAAFFLAVAVVLVAARIFGWAATKIGQPRVMGEVIAGITLGPSVLGAFSPDIRAAIFPTDILPALGVAANLGLIFYMFLIGLEVDFSSMKGKASRAAAISNASVALPMLVGIAVALPLYKLLGPNKKFAAFAIFMGVSMSITAFPVLARILAERRMIGKPLGSMAIACAAIDDVTAWFLIALASTIAVSGGSGDVVRTIVEALLFTAVMLFAVRPFLRRMATAFDEVGRIPGVWFAAIIIGVLLTAYVTETIHIAFIFGGFMMGAVMPRHAHLTEEVTRRVEDFVVTLLLPVFFLYTGLKTNITLLDRPALWLITIGLIAVAVFGKLAGATVAARISGYNLRESTVIGVLMNTRGLTELIVLNLALTTGAISPALYAALVLMAIVTTGMAGPALKLLDPRNEYGSSAEDEVAGAARASQAEFPALVVPERAILVAPQTDAALGQLVALAAPLASSEPKRELIITRLIQPPRAAGVRGSLQTENAALQRATKAIDEVRNELAEMGLAARGVALTSSSVGSDLVHVTEREPVDLVLIDGRRRLIGEGVPLGEVSTLLELAPCDAAVLVANSADPILIDRDHPVVVPFGGAEHDWAALELASWISSGAKAPLKLLGAAGQTDDTKSVTRSLADAGLVVQQSSGITSEPVVVEGGGDAIVQAATGAGLLVIGMSERWRKEGLGHVRSEIAKAAPAPVLFVRRGVREGLFAPRDNATQFKWSMGDRPVLDLN